MSARHMDSVRVRNAPLMTGYGGQEVRDWAHASAAPGQLLPASVQPLTTEENEDRRELQVTRWRLLADDQRVRAVLNSESRVLWEGLELEVVGDVGVHKLRGRYHHVEAVLRKVTEQQVEE